MVFDMFGMNFQSSLASTVKDLTLQSIMGLKNVQINDGKMLDLHDLLFQYLKHLNTIFLLKSKDHDRKLKSFPIQHTWT
jgi:hypothetical protein